MKEEEEEKNVHGDAGNEEKVKVKEEEEKCGHGILMEERKEK